MTTDSLWKSSGLHLTPRNEEGYLIVSEDLMRAYYTRPEIHPIEESCPQEHKIFERLMSEPFCQISALELDKIKDKNAEQNYQLILSYRDFLVQHQTLEKAYQALFTSNQPIQIPPLFINQIVHLITHNILLNEPDMMQWRMGELLFREQKVTTEDGQLMLADSEIIALRQKDGGLGSLGALISESGTPLRDVSLDVLTDENKEIYKNRSDNYDTAVDFRFTEPANDAFARILEKWIYHFYKQEVSIQPLQSIKDDKWRWHIGLDAVASSYLNDIYEGKTVFNPEDTPLIGLFSLSFATNAPLNQKPVYLGLAVTKQNEIKLKPQNLLTNLPQEIRQA